MPVNDGISCLKYFKINLITLNLSKWNCWTIVESAFWSGFNHESKVKKKTWIDLKL